MPVPSTPILSTFTGADEDPLFEDGQWAGPMQNGQGQLRRFTNEAFASPAGVTPHQSYRRAVVYAANQESYGFWGTLPAAGQGFACWARVTNPNSATLAQAVLGVYTEGTGFRIFELTTGGSFAQIGGTNTTVANDNEGLWLNLVSNGASLYYWSAILGWTLMISTPTTILGIGQIGLEMNGANIYATSFGGGSIVTNTYVSAPFIRKSRRVAW